MKATKARLAPPLLAAALTVLLIPATRGLGETPAVDESFHYHWQLRNIVGVIAGLFFPRQGEGDLSFKSEKNGLLRSELLITSKASKAGEYFRYGSELDAKTMQPARAWSSYLWRGETKSHSDEIEEKGVLDIVSGIYSIRLDPPTSPRRLQIWSDGHIYPVVVIPLGTEKLKVAGRGVESRHYSIRGVDIPEMRQWKGKLDIWLANDATATPVEILISRNLADLRLDLQPGAAPAVVPGLH
jgi:Protein of unknown function (DUF3108)